MQTHSGLYLDCDIDFMHGAMPMNATVKESLTPRTTDESSVVALATTLDARLNALAGYESNQIQTWLGELLEKRSVTVGWRESCGSTDRTARIHREWQKVVKLLRRDGVEVRSESQKHGNSWATKSGGFWSSVVYSLATPRSTLEAVSTNDTNWRE